MKRPPSVNTLVHEAEIACALDAVFRVNAIHRVQVASYRCEAHIPQTGANIVTYETLCRWMNFEQGMPREARLRNHALLEQIITTYTEEFAHDESPVPMSEHYFDASLLYDTLRRVQKSLEAEL